ncbi:MAG: O-antigen ligase family protein [Clostridia bacterium]|nr:O-antigen ligase family protein [Clostridia bacterium]
MKLSKRPFLDLALDFSFAFWFVAENIFLHSIVAVFALVLFMGLTIVKFVSLGVIKLKIPAIFVLYGIFVLVCYMNIWLGYSIKESLSLELGTTLIRNFAFLVLAYFYVTITDIERLKKIFVFATTAGSIFAMFMTLLTTGSFMLRGDDSIFNANTLAISAAVAICFIVCSKEKWATPYNIFCITVLSLLCIFSGTRKALIAAVITIVVYFVLKNPQKLLKNTIFILVFAVAVYFALLKIPFLYEMLGNRVESMFALLMGESGDKSAESRADFIKLGLEHFPNSPWLGHGINCFQTLRGAFDTYSHCNYIELLFSVGILGTLAYYSMYLFVLLYALGKYFKNRSDNVVLSIGVIISLFFIDFALVSYYERTNLILVIICLALITGEKKHAQKSLKTNRKS